MGTFNLTHPSTEAYEVLCLLKEHHNVLISGPPATGKSHFLAELRHWFKQAVRTGFSATGRTAFPAVNPIEECLPSPDRANRNVYSITFHQGTKYRDFVCGLTPNVGTEGQTFQVSHGVLYNAAEHAKKVDGASLIEIDEINRGPAVAVFGDTITAIESSKRLSPDGTSGTMTASFRMLETSGTYTEYSLPHHLYLVAAMNEADTSIEPLDVAFLRRFKPYYLRPNESLLRNHLSLQPTNQPLQKPPTTTEHVFEAAVQAWSLVNSRISLSRGSAFQIGHGIFMEKVDIPATLEEALSFAAEVWNQIFTHISEVFFGDTRAVAAVLNADENETVFKLEETYFANMPVVRLIGPESVKGDEVYGILCSVIEKI